MQATKGFGYPAPSIRLAQQAHSGTGWRWLSRRSWRRIEAPPWQGPQCTNTFNVSHASHKGFWISGPSIRLAQQAYSGTGCRWLTFIS
ncbi:MAG: hypothetical protein NZM15_04060 [Flavobacteriales bacterium]|nr:hypothetical protein [Flavobacteriales bacterium]MDW8431860.1 hypothetical protein [Flavobacteriales bacterium]